MRSRAVHKELVQRVMAFTDSRGGHTGVHETGLTWAHVLRSALPTSAHHHIYKPSLCVVLQGSKQMCISDEHLAYEAMQALIVRLELPAAGRIVDASEDEPFLGLTIAFDLGVLREVLHELGPQPAPVQRRAPGAFVVDLQGALADTILRFVDCLGDARALRILGPSFQREIAFRMLTGEHADAIRSIAIADGHMQSVADAIRRMHADIARPIRIPDLAKTARMSATAFHEHFKSLTQLTPLQYQKRLRLLEARRLLIDDAANAETAAFTVGYQSASQFSREYTRMFGTSPRRDAEGVRRGAVT